ncbi:MAG: PD-(D/E)XK nuclease family protein [Phycisphaerae bacterium]
MAVTLILGRAGAGKTRACLDAIVAALAEPAPTSAGAALAAVDHEPGPLLLLVPEQASFQMERALALRARGGGLVRAEVLSFSRLAHRVLAADGVAPTFLAPALRTLALRAVFERSTARRGPFATAQRTAGFFERLNRLVAELLREDVGPEALRAAAAALPGAAGDKVRAIAEILADYQAWLGPERYDPATQLALLRQRIATSPQLRQARIWVDGFAGFTGQELATLVALGGGARQLHITLLLDAVAHPVTPGTDELRLFHPTETTRARLEALFRAARVALAPPVLLVADPPPRFAAAPHLAALERGFDVPSESSAEPSAAPGGGPAADTRAPGRAAAGAPHARVCGADAALLRCVVPIRVLACRSHREELEQAARHIRAQIAASGGRLRFRDFAVIARDLEPLAGLVEEVFREYETPCFIDRRRPLSTHALSRFMDALLEAVASDFALEPAARLLRTGLLPLSREHAERLETVIRIGQVRGLRRWQEAAWDFGADRPWDNRPNSRAERAQSGSAADRAALLAARRCVVTAAEPLVHLAASGAGAPGATWAAALLDALEALRVRARIAEWIAEARQARDWETAETHRLAWDSLVELLDGMHVVLDETRLRLDDVAAVLSGALRDATIGLAPPTLDQVLVSAVERSRHPDIKQAWLMAFNEGVFPARPADDALLTRDERQALAEAGLEALGTRARDVFGERLLAYIAMTRPSETLTLSYATAAADGAEMLPSPLLDELGACGVAIEFEVPTDEAPPVAAVEAARGYLGASRERSARPAGFERHQRLRAALAEPLRAQVERLLRGLTYHNEPPALPDRGRVACGADELAWSGSQSEIETYIQCPFQHFARHALRLDPDFGPPPVHSELGTIAHAILADVTRRAIGSPGGVHALDDEAWEALVAAAFGAFEARLSRDWIERNPRLAFLVRVLERGLRELLRAHVARWRAGRFAPRLVEHPFDPTDPCGAVRLRLPDGRWFGVRGTIDRVDAAKEGATTAFVVYDYKPDGEFSNRPYLTQARLQLMTYVLAARAALGDDARCAGAFVAPLYPDIKRLEPDYVRHAPLDAQRMHLFQPRGRLDAQFLTLFEPATTAGRLAAVSAHINKDGAVGSRGDAVGAEQLAAYVETAAATLTHAVAQLLAGVIDASPLIEGRKLACRTCEYRAVCRFDRLTNEPRAAETELPLVWAEGRATGAADEAD